MRFYTVHHRPRLTAGGDDYAFVREGFSWGAFLVAPLWALYHGLWVVAFLIVVAAALVDLALDGGLRTALLLAAQVVFGYHAGDLRRFLLHRRNYRQVAVIAAANLGDAEARFFGAQPGGAQPEPAVPGGGAIRRDPANPVGGLLP